MAAELPTPRTNHGYTMQELLPGWTILDNVGAAFVSPDGGWCVYEIARTGGVWYATTWDGDAISAGPLEAVCAAVLAREVARG